MERLSKAASSCFFLLAKKFSDRKVVAFCTDLILMPMASSYVPRCSVVLCTKNNSLDERSCHASVKSGSLVIVTVVASGVVANCKFHFILAILCVRVCVRASMFFSSSNK